MVETERNALSDLCEMVSECFFLSLSFFSVLLSLRVSLSLPPILLLLLTLSPSFFPSFTPIPLLPQVGVAYMAADVRIDAEASFKESILHNPHNVKAMLGLALIHR